MNDRPNSGETRQPVMLPADVSMAFAHNGIRFALGAAPLLISSSEGDAIRRGIVAEYYTSVLVGIEVHHHGEEELLYPLLLDRFPEGRAKVGTGAQQHHDVLSHLAAATSAVTDWAAKGEPETGNVLSALASLEEPLSFHLDYEEAEIVPFECELTLEDRRAYWDRMVEHHMAALPPTFWFSFSHGQPLLWEAAGETAFRSMIAGVATKA